MPKLQAVFNLLRKKERKKKQKQKIYLWAEKSARF